jgi:hypothetical protein
MSDMKGYRMDRSFVIVAVMIIITAVNIFADQPRRRITPVNNAATETQAINEAKNDTARINAARRAASERYTDDNGNVFYVDTLTGEKWVDSTAIKVAKKHMQYPLLHSASLGVDIWNPAMRIFGQKYGLTSAWLELSLHNRYKPIFELGLGQANYTPADGNFTYTSPLSVFFKLGMNYNFLFNSSPDYQFMAGLKYGFTPFSYSIDNVTVDSPYWNETAVFDIPAQHATVGWLELSFGLRVKLWGPISAGWEVRFRARLHESGNKYGDPWYIPGYGTRGSAMAGSFSISYTLPLKFLNHNEPVFPTLADEATKAETPTAETPSETQTADNTKE